MTRWRQSKGGQTEGLEKGRREKERTVTRKKAIPESKRNVCNEGKLLDTGIGNKVWKYKYFSTLIFSFFICIKKTNNNTKMKRFQSVEKPQKPLKLL